MPEEKTIDSSSSVAHKSVVGAFVGARVFSSVKPLLVSLRPSHWIKNGFLFAPLIFSGHFYQFDDIVLVIVGFVSFSFAASAIYLFNDVNDRDRDASGALTKSRPIARGELSVSAANTAAAALVAVSIIIGFPLGLNFVALLSLYLVNNVAYTLTIKTKVIADVISIASGFVLRILAGAALINVEASQWLIVCTFSLALLLGFGKRRAELFHSPGVKAVNMIYTEPKLDHMISVSAAVSLLSYMLYVVSPESIARFRGKGMIYTVPFVVYGIFRFLAKIQEGKAKDPVHLFYSDRISVVNAFCWFLTVMAVLLLAYQR